MTQRFSRRIANSCGFMISFTIFVSIVRLLVWRWPRRLSSRRYGSAPMQAKHTLRERDIFIADISITTVLWLNWKLLARVCPMTLAYSN